MNKLLIEIFNDLVGDDIPVANLVDIKVDRKSDMIRISKSDMPTIHES
jgi:hypothetical protein